MTTPDSLAALLEDCRSALMECDRDGDYPLIDRIDAMLVSSPPVPAQPDPLEALTREQERLGLYDDQFAPAQATQPQAEQAGEREAWMDEVQRAKDLQRMFSPESTERLIRAALQRTEQRVPMTEGQIWDEYSKLSSSTSSIKPIIFARAIEAHHGITSDTAKGEQQ